MTEKIRLTVGYWKPEWEQLTPFMIKVYKVFLSDENLNENSWNELCKKEGGVQKDIHLASTIAHMFYRMEHMRHEVDRENYYNKVKQVIRFNKDLQVLL